MKKHFSLYLISLVFMLPVKSQITFTLNTYYVIPPTMGCNGIWAVEFHPNCFAAWTIVPCATMGSVDGDTLFLQLCSIPCEFEIINDSGNVCGTCGVGYLTGTQEMEVFSGSIRVSPNPSFQSINLTSKEPSPVDLNFQIFDLQGKRVMNNLFSKGYSQKQYTISNIEPGIYFWNLSNENGFLKSGKICINR